MTTPINVSNNEYEALIALPSTQRACFDIYRLRYASDADPKALVIAEAKLELCLIRDKIQSERPKGCGCLGSGGYAPRYRPDGRGGAVRSWEIFCDCPDGQAERQRVDDETRVANSVLIQERIGRILQTVPPEWKDWTLRSWVTEARGDPELAKRLVEWLDTDAWLCLWGETGIGKTGAAWPLVKEFIHRGHSAAMVNVAEVLDDIRSRFGDAGTMRTQDKNPWSLLESSELLCLDDLGAQRNTDWANERLYALLNHRFNYNLRTIITSNDPPSVLRQKMDKYDDQQGARVCSRVLGKCGDWVFELRGKDRRIDSNNNGASSVRRRPTGRDDG